MEIVCSLGNRRFCRLSALIGGKIWCVLDDPKEALAETARMHDVVDDLCALLAAAILADLRAAARRRYAAYSRWRAPLEPDSDAQPQHVQPGEAT